MPDHRSLRPRGSRSATKNDGTYVVEFKTADGEALAINVPVGQTHILKHFQERMPYGLFVPDVNAGTTSKATRNARGRDGGFR
jgi:hypothetical protein